MNLHTLTHWNICAKQPRRASSLILTLDLTVARSQGSGDVKCLGLCPAQTMHRGSQSPSVVSGLACHCRMFQSVGGLLLLWGLGLHRHLERGGMQGRQMGVQVEEYCVLELTVIHNTSAWTARSPDICRREGDGGAVSKGCSVPGSINTAPSVT